jgi:hypothetical protein
MIEPIKILLNIFNGDEWTGINAIIATILLITILYGYKSLKQVAQGHRLNAAQIIFSELKESTKARNFVISKYLQTKDFSLLNDDELDQIKSAIDSLNRLGLLIETNTIPQHLVFSIAYVSIIQAWYKLEPYANYKSNLWGVPYAARVGRISTMAKNYFDSHKKFKNLSIQISDSYGTYEIYKTKYETGYRAIIQRFFWFKMRLFDDYRL